MIRVNYFVFKLITIYNITIKTLTTEIYILLIQRLCYYNKKSTDNCLDNFLIKEKQK